MRRSPPWRPPPPSGSQPQPRGGRAPASLPAGGAAAAGRMRDGGPAPAPPPRLAEGRGAAAAVGAGSAQVRSAGQCRRGAAREGRGAGPGGTWGGGKGMCRGDGAPRAEFVVWREGKPSERCSGRFLIAELRRSVPPSHGVAERCAETRLRRAVSGVAPLTCGRCCEAQRCPRAVGAAFRPAVRSPALLSRQMWGCSV